MLFSKRLKSLRDAQNLSQKEFAALLEINPVTLSHYENGKREPDLKRLVALCSKLGVTADYLLGLSSTPQPQATQSIEASSQSDNSIKVDLLHHQPYRCDINQLDQDLQDKFCGYFERLLDEQNERKAAKSKEA